MENLFAADPDGNEEDLASEEQLEKEEEKEKETDEEDEDESGETPPEV